MPFDINVEHLKIITKTWENLKHYEFGKHKKCPIIHNPNLHIYLENFNRKEIPDQITFRNRFVAVNIDGKPSKIICNYCKNTNHQIEDCPIKIQTKKTEFQAIRRYLNYLMLNPSHPRPKQSNLLSSTQ